jgi:hypothetical protein
LNTEEHEEGMNLPTEMKIICPYCGYDHEQELAQELDAWVSEEPYQTECVCEKNITVHTHVTYSFSVTK